MLDASLIVPTYGRAEVLERTLARVGAIDYPRERWEAIVVDDGSMDDTGERVRRWIATTPVSARLLRQPNAGPAAARNLGAAQAMGATLVFIDNDVAVRPDFVGLHVAAHREHPRSLIVGRVMNPEGWKATPFGRYRFALWERFHEAQASDRPSPTSGVTGQNLSIAASDFRALGGFDPGFTIASCEDWELGERARRAGLAVLYHPGITVVHDDWAVSLDSFCERQRLYAISDVLLWTKYGERSPRLAVVRENGPIARGDGMGRALKKAVKLGLATAPGRALLGAACKLAERVRPDGALSRRAYDAAVAVAIFRGVREGHARYGAKPGPRETSLAAVDERRPTG